MFDLELIKQSTGIGQIDYHHQIGSTNDRAIELIKQGTISTPTLVLTKNQTAGRGQRDRIWLSDEGSLTFTWIISSTDLSSGSSSKPIADSQTNDGPLDSMLPILVPLAICYAVESTTELSGITIKWPNDLLVENQKLCGILIESVTSTSSNSETHFVVGIGINVNNSNLEELLNNDSKSNDSSSLESSQSQSASTHSQDDRTLRSQDSKIAICPTSIFAKTNRTTCCSKLLIAIANQLESCRSLPREEIIFAYNQRLAFRGEKIRIKEPGGEECLGICEGIDSSGGLIVKIPNDTRTIFSGTITAV
ncbi:MAG: biotin--[acetyl-CoA-carboxylase] ligase [Mariniblastus sp.]